MTSRSPSAFHAGGYAGDDPVAMTTRVARRSACRRRRASCHRRSARSRGSCRRAGIASTPCVTKPTKRSRSRAHARHDRLAVDASSLAAQAERRRSARPRARPRRARSAACSACSRRARRSFRGRRPRSAARDRPAAFAARYAARPAVPAPITATSVFAVRIVRVLDQRPPIPQPEPAALPVYLEREIPHAPRTGLRS